MGGQSLSAKMGGAFYAPTLIEAGDDQALDMATSEIFGPVATVYRVADEAGMIRMANDTRYGLAAYLYTNDVGRVHRMSEALEFGMVGVNAPLVGSPSTPFGGVKDRALAVKAANGASRSSPS